MLRSNRRFVFATRNIPRPALKREDDPQWWDEYHAKQAERIAEGEALKPENWSHGRQLALLRIQRSDAAEDCIAHLKGIEAKQEDFTFLREQHYAYRKFKSPLHDLTASGKRVAREVCRIVAHRLGLHHITYDMDRWTEHKVRCTCGWHQSLNRRNNEGALKYLQDRADRHLQNPDAWKREQAGVANVIASIGSGARTLPVRAENPDNIDTAHNVYGDGWPDVTDACDQSPSGHHEYDAINDPERCLHCKRKT
jgi:hypothetical protein